MQLNVPFSEIPEHGIECEIKDSSWFPKDRLEKAGPVYVRIRLIKKSDNRIELHGKLQVDVMLECDRCLGRFVFHVDSTMQLVIEVPETNEHWRLQDMELAEGELEIISQENPVVDLVDILCQQLLLGLPEKKLCNDKCPGLCSKCGKNMNEGDCGCTRQATNSPFAILETLKKNN